MILIAMIRITHCMVVSGSSAIGYEPERSSHEDMPFYPFDRHLPYGFTKHLTEHECLKVHANGLSAVVAAFCAIIGPHNYVPARMGRVLIDYAHGSLRAYIPGGFEFVSSRGIAEGHKNLSFMLPIDERTTRVFFLFYFDALKIPLISMKTPKWLTQMVLNIAKPLVFKPILEEDGIALEAELLAYETYWNAPPIELNPVVPMFQRLSARKWEEYLARKETAQAVCGD